MKKQSSKTNAKKTKSVATEVDATEVDATEVATTPDQPQNQNQLTVDVEYLKTTNVHLVLHCPTGSVSENTFISVIKFGNIAKQLGVEWSVETTVNETITSRAKNMLVAKFMTLPEKTHILFVDPEIGFEPWHVLVLLDRKVDVISGLYPAKTLPIRWTVSTFEGAEETEDGLHEVDRVGSGFLLVSRNVFENMKTHAEVKQFTNDVGLGEDFDKELYSYFSTQLVDNRFIPEDTVFSAICRALGSKLWVDKRVTLSNKGVFNYSVAAQDILLNSYGNMYLDYMKSTGKVQVLEENKTEKSA